MNALPASVRVLSLTVTSFVRHLKGLGTCFSARSSASEDFLFCTTQMHSLLLVARIAVLCTQMQPIVTGTDVVSSVGHNHEPYKYGRTDRDAL